MQKDVVFGLQQGTKVLKQIHAEMGEVEQVEKLIGENEEARAYQKEISEMLAGQMSNQDEDEVEDELEVLEKEIRGSVVGVEEDDEVRLPTVPDGDLPALGEDEAAGHQRERARARAREGQGVQRANLTLA